jgi:Protein of unknown function (DUF2851)
MNERLLQFIWQFQYFNQTNLRTVDDEVVEIIHAGTHNTNEGPDFLNAQIKIGNKAWAGSVELHTKSSFWKSHKHEEDKNYKNVILHVVWEEDKTLNLNFPTLVLQDRISNLLLSKYQSLMNENNFIPCQNSIHQVKPITWLSWKERLLVERLQNKSQLIFDYLQKNNNHWEEAFWWLIAKNFGIKINSNAFEAIAQSISINVLAKHKNQIHQIEALLFGQAGLLNNNFEEDYPNLLKKEYEFYKNKYQLKHINQPIYFLRMRPSNFPSVRLAQLAQLIFNSLHLFATVKEASSLTEIKKLLQVTANDYWHYHYVFDKPTDFKEKNIGLQMVNNILINTIVPIVFAYGHFNKEEKYINKALAWLREISPEKNTITKEFKVLKVESKTAFDSQALIQLKNNYCNHKKCLQCAVGNSILKNV